MGAAVNVLEQAQVVLAGHGLELLAVSSVALEQLRIRHKLHELALQVPLIPELKEPTRGTILHELGNPANVRPQNRGAQALRLNDRKRRVL